METSETNIWLCFDRTTNNHTMKIIQTLLPSAMTMLAITLLTINPSELPAQRGNDRGQAQHTSPRNESAYGHRRAWPPEQVIRRLPRSTEEHAFRGQNFYSHRGIFYQEVPRGFVITRAPVGLRVARLPRGAQKVGRGRDAYYFSQGNFYMRLRGQKIYEVIPEPGRSGWRSPRGSRALGHY